ncbi:hypothetical protein P0R31_25035 [Bradyrhizobium yuanmingense]|nr:hypothetical protein [Bradyrhizobium yuanmingense]
MIAGVFTGSTKWAVLSTTVASVRTRLTTRVLLLSSRLTSLMLLGLGAAVLLCIAPRLFEY